MGPSETNPWLAGDGRRGAHYDQRFEELAASGVGIHGEADLVASLAPGSVLDAGCGTGRVAIELARRGIEVVGVDLDPAMLAEARAKAPALQWVEADLARVRLNRRFDVVVMAGNVPLFTPEDERAGLVAGCARHLGADGRLVAGFQLDRGYSLERYDRDCLEAGLAVVGRFATWEGEPFDGGDYAVSVHCRAVAPGR